MPIDIKSLREYLGGKPEVVRESQRRRFGDVGLVDQIIFEDEAWRRIVNRVDKAKEAKNSQQKEITKLKKAKEDVPAEMLSELKRLDKEVQEVESSVEPQASKVRKMLARIGNIVDDSVPVSQDEEKDNEVVTTWGSKSPQAKRSHHELLYMIGGYEPDRGARVAGHRAYFLTDVGVLLNQAVINYGIAFLRQRQYTVMQPPFFMNKEVMAGVAQLEQFDEELYKVTGSDEKYLIATSEQPICAFHKGEWLKEQELPKRYGGISTCFRKEAGAHGRDTWGIFRVHQFEKVEQFCITVGDMAASRAMHEEMREIAEAFVQSFGFPYRVVNIVSGELNNAAIKKYDLEAWFPYQQQYRELVSCSNCTDYQSRGMEIRCGQRKLGDKEKKYVHMLNSTLCAAGRTICCLLETGQTDAGVTVPPVLVPYMGGLDFLPFVRNMDGSPFLPPKKESPLASKIVEQGDVVRSLKAAKAPPADVAAAVEHLKALKAQYEEETGEEYLAPGQKPSSKKKQPKDSSASSSAGKTPKQQPSSSSSSSKPPPKVVAPKLKQERKEPAAAKVSQQDDLLTSLEATLTFSSYVGGFEPSARDAKLYDDLTARTDLKAGPNVTRWLTHLASFDPAKRASWP
ncbi:hypothetical protein CTAYLR_009319 [Chrysophaeum taylorii]|uniref:serine--tRNA ligase n=1 Tax=Chrysophaeum taylorii TaxID=2483200 RepID=A0AAD7XKH4_9STRA|nr:hypothetical protein CTAYLR_009319 [Chrysophaeum taylorii]